MPIIEHVNITGIACCVPSHEVDNETLKHFSSDDISKIIENTGVKKRRVVDTAC